MVDIYVATVRGSYGGKQQNGAKCCKNSPAAKFVQVNPDK